MSEVKVGAYYQIVKSPVFDEGSVVKALDETGFFGSYLFELVHGGCMYNNAPGKMPGAFDGQSERILLEPVEGGKTAKELGFEVGDRFVNINNMMFSPGALLELYWNDDSTSPLFRVIDGDCMYTNADGMLGAYSTMSKFVKLVDSTEQEKVEVKAEVNTVINEKLKRADELETQAGEFERQATLARDERAKLIGEVEDLLPTGWSLVQDFSVRGSTNWKDWSIGDKVVCTSSKCCDHEEGDVLEVVEKEDEDYDGVLPVLFRNVSNGHTAWAVVRPDEEPKYRAM